MLVPDDRGATRTLSLNSLQVWGVIAVFALISFTSAFFFQRNSAARRELEEQELANRQLEREISVPVIEQGVSEDELARLEADIRGKYESRISTITSELNELYEIEAEVRTLHGLPPRTNTDIRGVGGAGGRGGAEGEVAPSGGQDGIAEGPDLLLLRPANMIYGLRQPSADLILEEINLRRESLRGLVLAMNADIDRIERTPSIWPSTHPDRWISSRPGNRIHPITRRRHYHSGTDIVAPRGTPVVSTAKGKVVFSDYDQYLGHYVKVDHGNGYITLYAHLDKRYVNKGDQVERGQPIGTLGNTGRSTGAHVHYEVHVSNKVVNSAKYFGN